MKKILLMILLSIGSFHAKASCHLLAQTFATIYLSGTVLHGSYQEWPLKRLTIKEKVHYVVKTVAGVTLPLLLLFPCKRQEITSTLTNKGL